MHRTCILATLVMSGAVLTAACNRGADYSNTNAPVGSAQADQSKDAAITVSGCLQRGPHDSFLLTHFNEPLDKGVGTAGSGAAVEREQLRQAAATYNVKPDGAMRLEDSVGKEVQVVGIISAKAELPRPEAQNSPTDRAEIGAGDVTEIKASSVSIIAETCRGAAVANPRD